jgi:hypothetical protein
MNEKTEKDETTKREAHANGATDIVDVGEEESLFSGPEFSKMSNVVLAGIMSGSAFSCAVLLAAAIVAAALFGMSQGMLWCVSLVVVGVSCGILQQSSSTGDPPSCASPTQHGSPSSASPTTSSSPPSRSPATGST